MSESILNLINYGIDRNVLIIGGGTSIKDFRFDLIPDKTWIFGINFQFLNKTNYGHNVKLDLQLYTDKAFADLSNNMNFDDTILIGHKPTRVNDINLLSPKADYWFNKTVIKTERDSVHYAIQICHNIMKFNKIFVIGLDAYSNGYIHYWNDEFEMNGKKYKIHETEKKMINKIQFKKMVKYYSELKDYNNVYNCNTESKIKVFPFGLPWGIYG